MKVLVSHVGTYRYLYPILLSWAEMMNYLLPDISYIADRLKVYYSDEFDKDTTVGNHAYDNSNGTHVVKIRPGHKDELDTWAHELAHVIQAYNLRYNYHNSYKEQLEKVGYRLNIYEIQARRAGHMCTFAAAANLIEWHDKYSEKIGEHSYAIRVQEEEKTVNTTRPSARNFGGMWLHEPIFRYETRQEELARKKMWRELQRRHNQMGRR